MKNSLACPKCDSRKLWRIDKSGTDREYANTLGPLRVAVLKNPSADRGWLGSSDDFTKTGYFSAFICAGCGYTEFWAHSHAELWHAPEQGVHFIDTTPQQSEYR